DVIDPHAAGNHLVEVHLLVWRALAAGEGVVKRQREPGRYEALQRRSPIVALPPCRVEEPGVHARQQPVYGRRDPAVQALLEIQLAWLGDRKDHLRAAEDTDIAAGGLRLGGHGDVVPFQRACAAPLRVVPEAMRPPVYAKVQ